MRERAEYSGLHGSPQPISELEPGEQDELGKVKKS